MGASHLKGVNYTINDSYSPASDSQIGQGKWGGEEKIQLDSCDVSGLEADSTVKIGRVPAGSTITGIEVTYEALGTSVTLAIGDGTTADKFLAAAAAATAGKLSAPGAYAEANLSVTVDTDIVLTVGGATIDASKNLKTIVRYVR